MIGSSLAGHPTPQPVMLSKAKHLWLSFQRWQKELSQRFFASLRMTMTIDEAHRSTVSAKPGGSTGQVATK
jgi:hypothetical protein